METLIINIKDKKDSKLIKELLSRLNVEIMKEKNVTKNLTLAKSRIKSIKDLKKMGGIAKGQLINKEHLTSLAWKKRG